MKEFVVFLGVVKGVYFLLQGGVSIATECSFIDRIGKVTWAFRVKDNAGRRYGLNYT